MSADCVHTQLRVHFSQLCLNIQVLHTELCGVFRFSVLQTGRGLEEVVPSSNPASQCSIGTAEVLWLLDGVESSAISKSPWEESFSPCTPDACCFTCDGGNWSI